MCTFAAALIAFFLVVSSTIANSDKHEASVSNLSKSKAHYHTNNTSKIYDGSLHRLFKSYDVQEDKSDEPKSSQDGVHPTSYRTNYVDVRYYVGKDEFKASTLKKNSTKYEEKNGTDFTDVAAEFATARPLLNISAVRIIDVPKRRCPDGQKLDSFGICKTVWNI